MIADLDVKAALLLPFTSSFVVTDRRFGGSYRKGLFSSEQFQFPLANIASVGVGTGHRKAGLLLWIHSGPVRAGAARNVAVHRSGRS